MGPVRAPRGTAISCKGWVQEGIPHALQVIKRGRGVYRAAPGAAADCGGEA
jgi:hypothetical protein